GILDSAVLATSRAPAEQPNRLWGNACCRWDYCNASWRSRRGFVPQTVWWRLLSRFSNWGDDRVSGFRRDCARAISAGVGVNVYCALPSFLQHRPVKYGDRKRDAAIRASDGICGKHLHHSRARRRSRSTTDWIRGGPHQHGCRISRGDSDDVYRRSALVVWREISGDRYGCRRTRTKQISVIVAGRRWGGWRGVGERQNTHTL